MSVPLAQIVSGFLPRAVALFAAGASVLVPGGVQAADTIRVKIDQAQVYQLPDNTSTIILGNPVVADITLLKKSNRMVVTGKSYGTTNLLALDASGNAISETIVRVAGDFKGLIVQRGLERESYDCSPRCQPTINLGDSGRYLGETAGMIKQYGSISSGK